MPLFRVTLIRFFFLLLPAGAGLSAFGQSPGLPIKEWVKKLSAKSDKFNDGLSQVHSDLIRHDSVYVFNALDQLKSYEGSDPYFTTRYLALKMGMYHFFKLQGVETELKEIRNKVLQAAYQTADDYLIFYAVQAVGSNAYSFQQLEMSATYLLKAEELHGQIKEKKPFELRIWLLLGEVLFHTRDYERCIYYTRKVLAAADTTTVPPYSEVRMINTIGQAYQQLHQLDSALFYYELSNSKAKQLEDPKTKMIWTGINSGFMGQLFYYKKEYERAKHLLMYDYSVNKVAEPNIAALSLQWLAKIDLEQGRDDSALYRVREALQLLRSSRQFGIQRVNYLRQVYATTADVFNAYDHTDSLYHYTKLYQALHDSLETVAFRSGLAVLKTRLDNEKNYQLVTDLQKGKKTEKLKRNFIISFIILLSIIALLYLNKLRNRQLHKAQLALQEKNATEALARGQLQSLTQNLVEKAGLVEELQRQLSNRTLSAEKQELASAISGLTILTDTDWEKFKSLFEQLHPGFFMNLQEKVKDITLAELRMAALTRLRLSANQIASILGISPNSVYKTKQRLRQRLNLDNDTSIEDVIASI